MRVKSTLLAAIAAVTVLGYSSLASADMIFTIDPSQSTITITGDVAGAIPIVAQSPGSNVATFNGSVDISLGGGNITFNSATADADLQALPQSPGIGGVTGSAPADVGLSIGPGLGTVALRDFIVSLTGTTALVGGTDFDLTALQLEITGGTLDYNVPAFSLVGSEDLSGTMATPTSGTGTLIGNTLTIPVDVAVSFEVSTGIFANVALAGQLVAIIPEPSSIAMLGAGLIGLVAVGYRRFRKV